MNFQRAIRKPGFWIKLTLVLLLAIIAYGLFQLTGLTYFSDVFVWFPNGRIQKVSPAGNGLYYQPQINPEGTQVVFFGNETGSPRIWKADIASGEVIALTPPDVGARQPAFSWDGSQIVFASDMNSGQEHERVEQMHGNGKPPRGLVVNIFVMDADGRNIRQVTFGPYQDQRPSFSPDGKTIAFVSNRGGEMRLWSIPVKGGVEPRSLQSSGWGYRPCFSTNGRWIFFFTNVNGRDQISKIPVEGGKVTPLLNDDRGTSHGPFADPGGKFLLMHSTRGGKWGIWELPLDGSPPRPIQPPGFEEALHASRAKNGVIAFDVSRRKWVRIVASWLYGRISSLIPGDTHF